MNKQSWLAVVIVLLLAGGGAYLIRSNIPREPNGTVAETHEVQPGEGTHVFELEPPDGAVISGTNAWIRFNSPGASAARVFWRIAGDDRFRRTEATDTDAFLAQLEPLAADKRYEYVVEVDRANGKSRSAIRTFKVASGIDFEPATVEATIARDYDQTVMLTLVNTTGQELEVKASALRHFDELPADIVGPGSADMPVVLASGGKLPLRLAVNAADARPQTYDIPLSAGGAFAVAKVKIASLKLKLSARVVAQDAVTLAQTIEIKNEGDALTDLAIKAAAEHAGDVRLSPAMDHAYLGADGTVRVVVSPVLYLEFQHLATHLECTAGGQSQRIPVSFQSPADRRLVGFRLGTQERGSSSDYYCTNKPDTCSTLPGPRANGPTGAKPDGEDPRPGSCHGRRPCTPPPCDREATKKYASGLGLSLGPLNRGPGPGGTTASDDCFPTADDAARAAIARLNPLSISERREFGGQVGGRGDCWYWTFDCFGAVDGDCVERGDPHNSPPIHWHTHGAGSGYERWSNGDLDNGFSRTDYLGTPGGRILKITITAGGTVNENNTQKWENGQWVPVTPQDDPIIINKAEPPLLPHAAARPFYRFERIGLVEALRYRALFSRQHRGPYASPVTGKEDDASGMASGWRAGERTAFAWHQDHDQVAAVIFDNTGEIVQPPLVIGKGRWPRVTVDGTRTAVAFAQDGETKVRLHDADGWREEIGLPGVEAAIAFAPDGPLHAITAKGRWKLVDGVFQPIEKGEFAQPALAVDDTGTPHVAWQRDGKIVAAGRDVAAGSHPSLAVLPSGVLYLAYQRPDHALVLRRFDGKNWSAETKLAGQGSSWPALAQDDKAVRVTYLGPAEHGPEALWLLRESERDPVLIPSLAGNIVEAGLLLSLRLRNDRTAYRPHTVQIYWNDLPIKSFTNAIPEGRYWLPLEPHHVFCAAGEQAPNRVRIRTRHMNGGAYSTASDYQLVTRTEWSEHFGFGKNKEDILRAHHSSRLVNHDQPDLAVLANSLDLPLKPPPDGEVDFPVRVMNLGEGAAYPTRLVMKDSSQRILAAVMTPYLAPGDDYDVTFRLQGHLTKVSFDLEAAQTDFDPTNDSLALNLWPLGAVRAKAPVVARTIPAPAGVERLGDIPVDSDARIAYSYGPNMRFGIKILKDHTGMKVGKSLTYAADGSTNTAVASVAGKTHEFGGSEGKWLEQKVPVQSMGDRFSSATKSSWAVGDLLFTQTLEIVPSQLPVRIDGVPKFILDTCLVRYRIENRGKDKKSAGMRLMIDTLIGRNDGVPFTVPGFSDLVTTFKEFRGRDVPDFVQALEHPDLAKPGTVAHVTLRVPGLETPERVSLTHWPGGTLNWNIDLRNIGGDSALVLYWPERELEPGEQREFGFTYGLGSISGAGPQDRLALAIQGRFEVGRIMTVMAYVHNPGAGETIKLELPPGLVRIQGAEQQVVPALSKETGQGNTALTWRVRAAQSGTFAVRARLSSGPEERREIRIRARRPTTINK
jgi:hypothetical protein